MAKATCKVEGCERPVLARGLCGRDYDRARKGGELPLLPKPTLEERFWAKVDKDAPGGCWLWTASLNSQGYGQVGINHRPVVAHRIAYTLLVGPIPDGLELDHLCHTRDVECRRGEECPHRRCVNPAHLEAVPHRENALRGRSPMADLAAATHCTNGHEWTPENTRLRSDGTRICRSCHRHRERERRRKSPAA